MSAPKKTSDSLCLLLNTEHARQPGRPVPENILAHIIHGFGQRGGYSETNRCVSNGQRLIRIISTSKRAETKMAVPGIGPMPANKYFNNPGNSPEIDECFGCAQTHFTYFTVFKYL